MLFDIHYLLYSLLFISIFYKTPQRALISGYLQPPLFSIRHHPLINAFLINVKQIITRLFVSILVLEFSTCDE
mgnify:CR=1 FL=1